MDPSRIDDALSHLVITRVQLLVESIGSDGDLTEMSVGLWGLPIDANRAEPVVGFKDFIFEDVGNGEAQRSGPEIPVRRSDRWC